MIITKRLKWMVDSLAGCTGEHCIVWPTKVSGVYPVIKVNNKFFYAHRIAYEWKRRPLGKEERLYQQCDTLHCVNPWHYETVRSKPVHKSPHRRLNGAHCGYGHLLTEENVYITKLGKYVCRTCKQEAYRRSIARKKGVSHG